MRARLYEQAFALPTILISSVVMLIVLVSAVTAASSVNVALDRDFYRQLAREAAESGVVRAVDCLKDNNYTAQWTSSLDLRPAGTNGANSPCTGRSYTCVNDRSCLLIAPVASARSQYRTYFSVNAPTSFNQGDSQLIRSIGTVDLLRPDGSAYETITATASLRVPTSASVDDIDAIIFGE